MRLRVHHSVEVVGLLPPVLYFFVIIAKGTLGLIDAAILCGMYVAYLVLLLRLPPRSDDVERPVDVPLVSRWALSFPGRWRGVAVLALFFGGGAILYFTAHPFLDSLLSLAVSLGVSEFVFVQWVAPFLSEFPEKVSAFLWARRITRAPVAIMNLVSSNINQWSVLSGLIPVIYCVSRHSTAPLPLDHHQRIEILLTVLQSLLGWLLLASMSLTSYEAASPLSLLADPVRPSGDARRDDRGLRRLVRARDRPRPVGAEEVEGLWCISKDVAAPRPRGRVIDF